jgi:hypothetical protein
MSAIMIAPERYGGRTMRLLVGSVALAAIVCAATTASAQTPQQSQMNNAANVGRHASDASSKASSDEPKIKANKPITQLCATCRTSSSIPGAASASRRVGAYGRAARHAGP